MPQGQNRTEKMLSIRAVVCDLDGVLTDGGLPYAADGDSLKVFNTKDNVGFRLAQAAGWPTAIFTARRSAMVERWAADIGVPKLFQGVIDKAAAVLAFAKEQGLEPAAVAFLGDDLLDLPAMAACGLGVATQDAVTLVRRQADLVLESAGGDAAFRELVDRLLEAQGRTAEVAKAYYAAQGVAVKAALIDEVAGPGAHRIGFVR